MWSGHTSVHGSVSWFETLDVWTDVGGSFIAVFSYSSYFDLNSRQELLSATGCLVNTEPSWQDRPFHSCPPNTHIYSPDTSHICRVTVPAGRVLIAADAAAISFAAPAVWVLRLNLPQRQSDRFSVSLWTLNYFGLFCMRSSLSDSLSWSPSSQMVVVHLPEPFAFARGERRLHSRIRCLYLWRDESSSVDGSSIQNRFWQQPEAPTASLWPAATTSEHIRLCFPLSYSVTVTSKHAIICF